MEHAPQSRYLTLKLSDITPYPDNPRTISAEAINAVSESLNQFGYLQPLVVDENNVLIIGHTRYSAMRRHGVQRVEVLQVTGLTSAQVQQLRIADNRTGEFTSWDHDALESEFDALDSQLLNTLFPELAPADLDAIENDTPDTGSDDFVDLDLSNVDDSYNDNDNDNTPQHGTTEAVCPHCYHSWEVTSVDVIDLTQ